MVLEKMEDFFHDRLDGYDEHMLTCIDSAQAFYAYTADQLPKEDGACVLDLGCGTGLELEQYFLRNAAANVTGIDLTPGMLNALKEKFPKQSITLVQGSYFTVPFGEEAFDAAVSVESLHHFTKEEKIPLYTKLQKALRKHGYFILTDYFALSEAEEQQCRQELLRLKAEQGILDDAFYHYDTPLTVRHEKEALMAAGFTCVEELQRWGATVTLKASK